MATLPKATEYLANVNWKSLIEWLTAEVILNRPVNPLMFCRDIIANKLSERNMNTFHPEKLTDWLRNCYSEATALVDENGVINGKIVENSNQSLQEQLDELKRKIAITESLLESTRVISSLNIIEATANIHQEIKRNLNCDHCFVYLIDKDAKDLVLLSHDNDNSHSVHLPLDKGVPGMVAITNENINISDVYSDPRYLNSEIHKKFGVHTVTSLLCVPVKNNDDRVIGAVEAVNKIDSLFLPKDEAVLTKLSIFIGNSLTNVMKYRSTETARHGLLSLIELIRTLQHDTNSHSLASAITTGVSKAVGADRASLFLFEDSQRALFAMQGDVSVRIPVEQGIIGHVITTGQTRKINNAYEDPLFNSSMDKKTGYLTKSILCVIIHAMVGSQNKIIGAIQLTNKVTGMSTVFDDNDVKIVTLIADIIGPLLLTSQIFKQLKSKGRAAKVDISPSNVDTINEDINDEDA